MPIEFLRPIPSVALIPLAVLIYGQGLESKVFLVAFASFWPLLIQTIYGVQDVDPVATDTARSFGLGRLERMWRITVPSAVPYIATGIRISSAVALILAVTAELVIGAAGLGREINVARSGGNLDAMYALIVATGLLGWAAQPRDDSPASGACCTGIRPSAGWRREAAHAADRRAGGRDRGADRDPRGAVRVDGGRADVLLPAAVGRLRALRQHVGVRALRLGRVAEPAPDGLGYVIAVVVAIAVGRRARQLAARCAARRRRSSSSCARSRRRR